MKQIVCLLREGGRGAASRSRGIILTNCSRASLLSTKPNELMNSRFYYPTNAGSLGEPRHVHDSASPTQQYPSSHFQAEHAENGVLALNILRTKKERRESESGRQSDEITPAQSVPAEVCALSGGPRN